MRGDKLGGEEQEEPCKKRRPLWGKVSTNHEYGGIVPGEEGVLLRQGGVLGFGGRWGKKKRRGEVAYNYVKALGGKGFLSPAARKKKKKK